MHTRPHWIGGIMEARGSTSLSAYAKKLSKCADFLRFKVAWTRTGAGDRSKRRLPGRSLRTGWNAMGTIKRNIGVYGPTGEDTFQRCVSGVLRYCDGAGGL